MAVDGAYVLGHAEAELERLVRQGRFFGELTEQLFRSAGVEPGMRVLDVGCGSGDVSLLLAAVVGPTGSVVGVDRSLEAVAVAAGRAHAAALDNVSFVNADAADLRLDEPVDAIVGRLVLVYAAEPAALVRSLARHARPGALVVFQELDVTSGRSEPRVPLYHRALGWVAETYRRAGLEPDTGSRLARVYRDAGLGEPELACGARAGAGAGWDGYGQLARIVATLLPTMEALGVATAAEVDVETLAGRVRAEALELDSLLVSPALVGAWARLPAEP